MSGVAPGVKETHRPNVIQLPIQHSHRLSILGRLQPPPIRDPCLVAHGLLELHERSQLKANQFITHSTILKQRGEVSFCSPMNPPDASNTPQEF